MKLLIAVESMTTLNTLLDEVVARSWPNGTEARLLSIVEDEEESWREERFGVNCVRREMGRREEQITGLAVERLRRNSIRAEVTIMRGNPKDLIPFAARRWTTDLILVRANSRADVRKSVLGSVAASVVDSAPCSVEVVRVADKTRSTWDKSGFRVLLPTDGSPASLSAAQAIAHTCWAESTEVKVVSVVNPLTYSLEELGLWREQGTDLAHRAIGEAVHTLKNAQLKVTGEVLAGRIVQGILESSRKWRADLIVVGTHDQRSLKRFLAGSTSAAVARRAHCSVRLVRCRGFPQNGYRNIILESCKRSTKPPVVARGC